jgi:hypothetical protein
MRKQLYWLSDAERKRQELLLPLGPRGAHREDEHAAARTELNTNGSLRSETADTILRSS